MKRFNHHCTIDDFVRQSRPEQSVCCYRRHAIDTTVDWFISHFPGKTLFPVKTNPDPWLLKALFASGIDRFDVASLFEIDLVSRLLPQAELYFMHPVKSRLAIKKAYFDYGVRHFVLDSAEELQKIREQTNDAKDLNLFVRLAVSNGYSEIKLSGKFGISGTEALCLLRHTRKAAQKMGVCFHVGSQCMNPSAFAKAITLSAEAVIKAGIDIDILDIGGGFPALYSNLTPPPLTAYMNSIQTSLAAQRIFSSVDLLCEAGRALVAESASLVVRIELRKENTLFINDGVYGSLYEAGVSNFTYPVRAIRMTRHTDEKPSAFKFYGPTCDGADLMPGPFLLPGNIQEGDYIEIGQLGAYGRTMQSNFNGFASQRQIEVTDPPLISIFDLETTPTKKKASV